MDGALPMSREGWMILTKRFMYFFFGLALANEIIWRSLSTDIWVNFQNFWIAIGNVCIFYYSGKSDF